jgi:hypothetical protein
MSTPFIIRASLVLLVLVLGICFPRWGAALCEPVERWGRALARRRVLAVFLVGLLAPLVRLALLPLIPIPQPSVHDEFSYLLAGETFASGRLANPTHPMWVHFETFHEDHQPTYMSIYPPAQGLILAAGQVLFGHPWYGVCLSMGIMCAVTCWMLQGWLPPAWALVGSLLVVLRLGVFTYWMNSYWGGAAPAIGGALVLGALPRLLRRPRIGISVVLGAGLAVLANSRPYEGLLLSLPTAAALAMWMARHRRRGGVRLVLRAVIPLAVVLLVTVAGMGYYNWRVFGNSLTLPYQINQATYAVTPILLWQSPQPELVYRHAVMRKFYVSWWWPFYENARTMPGFCKLAFSKCKTVLTFFLGFLLLIPLILVLQTLQDRRKEAHASSRCIFGVSSGRRT